MHFLRFALIALLSLSAAAAADAPMRVLFVGNSLTYSNDLPAMVARLGALDGRRIETAMLAHPNYSLGDHLDTSDELRIRARERWDLVVLQQGPSSLPESRLLLIRDSERVAALFGKTSVAMLMVWPSQSNAASWDRVTESYAQAAQRVNGTLIPAGAALRTALRHKPAPRLLGSDGFHPTVAGTYLAALVTYRTIAGHLPAGVDRPDVARRIAGARVDVTDEELKRLVPR